MIPRELREDQGPSLEHVPDVKGVSVLVVDDDPDARLLLKRLLEEHEVDVTLVETAQQAMEAMARQIPDVLLSDIGMPEEDGYMLIRRIRALPPEQGGNVPALALTAFARGEDRKRALLCGYQIHLSKPVEPAELVAVIASLAGRT
jgi:CheY-like chemotaxis protein